jgi:hypothetical protein
MDSQEWESCSCGAAKVSRSSCGAPGRVGRCQGARPGSDRTASMIPRCAWRENMRLFALLITLVTVAAWAQSSPQPSDSERDDQHRHRLPNSTCSLNPTNNVVPVRFGSTFVDSPLYRSPSGLNIGLGVPTAGYDDSVPSLLSLIRGILEIHNNGAAQAIDLYVHNDAGFSLSLHQFL